MRILSGVDLKSEIGRVIGELERNFSDVLDFGVWEGKEEGSEKKLIVLS